MLWKRKEKSRITLLLDSIECDIKFVECKRSHAYWYKDAVSNKGDVFEYNSSGAMISVDKYGNAILIVSNTDHTDCLTNEEVKRIEQLKCDTSHVLSEKARRDRIKRHHDRKMELRCKLDSVLEKKGFK